MVGKEADACLPARTALHHRRTHWRQCASASPYLDTWRRFPAAQKHFFVYPKAGIPRIPDNPPRSWPVAATCQHSGSGGLTLSRRCIEAGWKCAEIARFDSNAGRLCELLRAVPGSSSLQTKLPPVRMPLSLARHGKPPATVAPAQGFSPKPDPSTTGKLTTPAANATTGCVSTTTSATTALAPITNTTSPAPITNTTSPAPITNTTSPAPITNTTSPAPITNTTSPAPITNTTSPAPITNTTSPAPITNTTSPAPITTTTTVRPTVTPPKPNPPADLIAGDYRLMKDKIVCLMAHVALQLRLETPKASGTFVVQPNKTRAVGECQENRANLTLVFEEGFITFMFNKSSAENIAYVDTLQFNLTYPLSNVSGHYAAANISLRTFPAKIGHSYACRSDSVFMGNGLYLDVKDDRMQAFNLTPSGEFGVTDHCAADQPDYRVAIGVGVTLLVLILVVVVVYLLGRKRRTDGYQSL